MDKDTALDLALGALEVGWSPTYTGLDAKEMGMKAITAIKQARSAPVQPVAWPAGLIDRIKAAEQRIQDGHAPRRIPADPTDVDLVLAEVRYLLEGKQPPFWIKTTPPAQPAPVQPMAFEVGFVEWVGNKLMATPKTTIAAPASWTEMVAANLVREGVNKHKARELAEHFYSLAQRPFVGLTNEERFALEYTPQGVKRSPIQMSFATEAKLKEKNT